MIQPGAESPARSRWPSLTTQIFIGLVLGIAVGYVWPGFAVSIRPLADAFLRLIKMIVAPLLFSTLVIGIAGAGDLKSLGRIGLKAIIYFEIATTVALVIGLALVNIFKPGAGLAVPLGGDTAALAAMAQNQQHAWDLFLHAFPTSIVDAMARGDILQVVVFATFFGVAVAALGPKGKPVYDLLEATALAMFKVTGYVMACAPIGVFAAIGATVGGKGLAVLVTLGKLVALMYLGLALFVLIVVVGVSFIIRVPFLTFLAAIREPFLIAFSTASSEAALPKALEVMERFGVPKRIVVVRAADRLQLQPRWHHAVPVARERVRRAAGRRRSEHRSSADDDADADAGEQGRRRRAARRARRADGDADPVRPAARRRGDSPGHRSNHGHGAHRGQRDGQLHCDGRRRPLGRRAGR